MKASTIAQLPINGEKGVIGSKHMFNVKLKS
jgi:hypothetical protein